MPILSAVGDSHGIFPGRALLIGTDSSFYVGRGQRIYRSPDFGATWELNAEISGSHWKAAFTWSRLACRALRHEISALRILADGARVAVAREGIYYAPAGQISMRRVFRFSRGSRPLNLCVTPSNDVLFGEYGKNPKRHEIFIYASQNEGRNFEVAYQFPAGSIRHIHNIIHDAFLDAFWVLAGDYGKEPGIALLSRDFNHLEWVARGVQQARAVSALVEPDSLLYATDTELEPNYIVRLDKKTGQRELLAPTTGSGLFAARYGRYYALSTAVGPSCVNRDRMARVYVSTDAVEWKELVSYEKDAWHSALQYGTITLAPSECAEEIMLFSGQAVRALDGRCRAINLH